MDEAELLHLAMADYMLSNKGTPAEWREEFPISCVTTLGCWRRAALLGEWRKALPLYLWIAVKKD